MFNKQRRSQKQFKSPLLEGGSNTINDSTGNLMDDHPTNDLVRNKVEKPEPLSRQQINQCLMEVEDIHPFRSVHFTDVLPFLKVFHYVGGCKKKPDLRYAMKRAIIDELRENILPKMENKETGQMYPIIPKNEEHSDSNPFLIAGYGVNSFFEIMRRLVYMFLIISLVFLPVMILYKVDPQQGILGLEKPSWRSMFNQVTLGNLGGAEIQCMTKRLEVDEKATDMSVSLKLTCPNAMKAKIVYENKNG